MMDMESRLKFYPFTSVVDINFWHQISTNKLDIYQLNDDPIKIKAYFRNGIYLDRLHVLILLFFQDGAEGLPPLANFTYESFSEKEDTFTNDYYLNGDLIITNTIEDFANKDKNQLIKDAGQQIIEAIKSDQIFEKLPESLSRFILIVYADLKKYIFHYWFAYPVLNQFECFLSSELTLAKDSFTQEQMNCLKRQHNLLEKRYQSYFWIIVDNDGEKLSLLPLKNVPSFDNEKLKIYLSFVDPCSDKRFPGWPLRNLLALATEKFEKKNWNIFSFRLPFESSLIFEVNVNVDSKKEPFCTGWEKNENNKLLPRKVNLSHAMEPKTLAENASDLNLKLMKWRLLPSLNLEKIAKQKCLLLGSGTLGCNIARALLAWGVKNITFVDNSRVSYSNPVRQTLFEFNDSLNGGEHKAIAAAKSLKRIFPSVNSKGIDLSIPMPGHHISESVEEQTRKDVLELENLIEDHDCIFLLMDTRESRWLPTLIANSKQKLVINAALGYDTFLVMRHGVRNLNTPSVQSNCNFSKNYVAGSDLGCYFCNDVVGPGNSTKDRTLDQQCTVTRPGISFIAAGLAVELMVSVLQHSLGANAPANTSMEDDTDIESESDLGIVPHQIRGFLSRFTQVMPTSIAFDCCTACSIHVLEAYSKEGTDFLIKVFNDTNYLEELTGLKKLHNDTNLTEVWALSDNESESNSI